MGGRIRKALRIIIAIQSLLQWFAQNPLGTATIFYVAGVFGVLVHAYFEPQDEREG